MLHGQSFHLGGLLLAEGFALGLGPGFAPLVGLAVGLSLSVLGAGGRRGGWLASGRRCSHGRTPRTSRAEGDRRTCREAVCGGGGSDKSHCCKREPRDPG